MEKEAGGPQPMDKNFKYFGCLGKCLFLNNENHYHFETVIMILSYVAISANTITNSL